ncbi:hypothetical protein RHGRI_016203 [Rhododendron griersonianum]|uniref:Uncharacterized protein n=1 Tax=Rhododendron griersonianum TaxID=479676 RepID=A0AAV6JSN7_9ERIC|nr:hypothetical protein RHGRI_016203 [Rhododendron griersonianum]
MVVIVAGEMADVGGKVEEEDGDFHFEEDGGGEADLSRIIGFGSVLLLSGLMEKVEILSFLCFGCKWAEQVLRGQCRGFDNFADDCEEEEAGKAGYSGGRDDAKVSIPATVVLSNMFSSTEMRSQGNLSSELETDVLLESMKAWTSGISKVTEICWTLHFVSTIYGGGFGLGGLEGVHRWSPEVEVEVLPVVVGLIAFLLLLLLSSLHSSLVRRNF